MKRFLCWDDKNIDYQTNVQIIQHKPEKKNIALLCDDEWEGECNGYGTIIKTSNGFRMYYRATVYKPNTDGSGAIGNHSSVICVAQSHDGIVFTKPDLGIYEYNGSKHNNIVFATSDQKRDTFSVLYDENPACPEEERFKALTEGWVKIDGHRAPCLRYFASADGIHFTEKFILDVRGTMDSYNPVLWDKSTEQYFLYYRAFHEKDGTDRLTWAGVDDNTSIRDVRVATSSNFRNWTAHGHIKFEKGQEDYSLYTNQITKYYRDDATFIGFPVRYCDRKNEKRNFSFMPLSDYRKRITEHYGREGTALTDCVIMTSSDGFTFNRRDEAFLTPGPESNTNWWYGNCYTVYGLIETQAEESGSANEISFYVGENYRIKKVNFRRYTIRLDGFFSWYAPYAGGELLTKPFVLKGTQMLINFATSVKGGITVSVCDENGKPLLGYESYEMFGNSVIRPVEFENPLSDLNGQTVRLKIKLKDTYLYSFTFQ